MPPDLAGRGVGATLMGAWRSGAMAVLPLAPDRRHHMKPRRVLPPFWSPQQGREGECTTIGFAQARRTTHAR
jgi:hypothetical protein